MAVKEVLHQIGLQYLSVELGEAEIVGGISDGQYLQLKNALGDYGLVLIENKKERLTESIKNVIVELVQANNTCNLH